MKKWLPLSTVLLFFLSGAPTFAQYDSTGLPGDHFSLEGALAMFRRAGSPEEFEKMLNTENNHVNNLDLNGDGQIDYVRVVEKADGQAHDFILQVPVTESESQDIAVIELEKTGDAAAELQIIGDADIYGRETIVEPSGDEGSGDGAFMDRIPGRNGPDARASLPEESREGIIVNVWLWPVVRFVYAPAYTLWISPWHWRYYPVWWRPWHPYAWRVFHPWVVPYHRTCVFVDVRREVVAHRLYTPVRVSSVTVRTRYQGPVDHYRVTSRTTTVTGPRGNRYSRRTTTVQERRGNREVRIRRSSGWRRRHP
ncbi:MAG TPA: hypothetical protein VG870_11335 [Chitinophagaceae bacterium]|nr:hypothetical protein [Chitinophagaceae bacterium]